MIKNHFDFLQSGAKMELDEENEMQVKLPKSATFADLFRAIDALEDKAELGDVHFEDELWNNFEEHVAKEVLSFRTDRASDAETVKVLEFFQSCGFSQEHVETFLPIDFD